ncbi:hypothetical protein AB0L63_14565 [Nocardia sp. NPDC051990]|uniref:hypothetical protein n=1 Tax=Nocardia sp. NPDC051990 TaxID=3155285 RepID=UPI00343BC9F0
MTFTVKVTVLVPRFQLERIRRTGLRGVFVAAAGLADGDDIGQLQSGQHRVCSARALTSAKARERASASSFESSSIPKHTQCLAIS